MSRKDKFSWVTRLKLCWGVLTKGKCDFGDYRTVRQQERFEICEKRRKELAGTMRPRKEFRYLDGDMEQ